MKSDGSAGNRKSPGELEHGFLPLPVGFEREMEHFLSSALKTFLVVRFRTIFNDHVQITTAALASIAGLSEPSVRTALEWLEYPNSRKHDEAMQLPAYIRRTYEQEHEHSPRQIQTIYVVNWKDPRTVTADIAKNRKAARKARTRTEESEDE